MIRYSKEPCDACGKRAWVDYDAAPGHKLCVHCIHARRSKATVRAALEKTAPQDVGVVSSGIRASWG